MSLVEVIGSEPDQDSLEELHDVVGEQEVLTDLQAEVGVATRFRDLLLGYAYGSGCVDVMKEGGFVLDIRDVDEDDDLVYLNPFVEDESCGVEIVGWGVSLNRSIEKVVLRKAGCDAANVALVPCNHSLGGGIAQNQNAGTLIGQRHRPDRFIAKAQ